MKQNIDLSYSAAIEQVMLNNNYFAPLKLIYKEIWKYKDKSKMKGETPDYTIQAIVQRDKKFTRIGLGVYALAGFVDKLAKTSSQALKKQKPKERLHAKIQGMLLEIGNNKKDVENTYTYDKSWIFDNKRLGSLSTLSEIPLFTYENIIKDTVRFFDVIWFNEKGFPYKVFEVEQSTNFRNAFIKFMELQDFQAIFYCISSKDREEKFYKELNKSTFILLKRNNRCFFRNYNEVENDYKIALSKTYL